MNEFLIGLQFLTRISVVRQTVWTEESFGGSVKYFPLIGAVLGICYALAIGGLIFLTGGGVPIFTGAVGFFLSVWLTGAIHCDGLMDSADGLFSGREREKMLEIMKDSRAGAFGVVALVTVAAPCATAGNVDLRGGLFDAGDWAAGNGFSDSAVPVRATGWAWKILRAVHDAENFSAGDGRNFFAVDAADIFERGNIFSGGIGAGGCADIRAGVREICDCETGRRDGRYLRRGGIFERSCGADNIFAGGAVNKKRGSQLSESLKNFLSENVMFNAFVFLGFFRIIPAVSCANEW